MGDIPSVSKSFFNFLPVFRISGIHQVLMLKVFQNGFADLGTNFQMVVLPTLQWYCIEVYVSPVDKCLKVTVSFKLTSSCFLKLLIDFLRWGVILSSIKSKMTYILCLKWFHPGKVSVAWYVISN